MHGAAAELCNTEMADFELKILIRELINPHIARRIQLCVVAGETVWSIVRRSIAVAMGRGGSAEM